jgi:5-methylcytosine-specific restriction protein B
MKLNSIIENIDVWGDWRSSYNHFVPKFIEEAKTKLEWKDLDDEVFFEFFEKSANQCVSSLQQGYFTDVEKEKIKDNGSSISNNLKKIASNQNEPQWDIYADLKRTIRKYTSQDRKASTNRMIAALQPNLLCTIVNERNLKELFHFLKKANIEGIPQFNGGNWFQNSHSILQFFKSQLSEYSYLDIVTLPWQVRGYLIDYLKNKQNLNLFRMKIAQLLLSKKQIILQGAPGTGKT